MQTQNTRQSQKAVLAAWCSFFLLSDVALSVISEICCDQTLCIPTFSSVADDTYVKR